MNAPQLSSAAITREQLRKRREDLELQSFISGARVTFGMLGLLTPFFLAIMRLAEGTGGLFAGGFWASLIRLAKFGFWVLCFWGLAPAWADYAEKQLDEMKQRRSVLARMEKELDEGSSDLTQR